MWMLLSFITMAMPQLVIRTLESNRRCVFNESVFFAVAPTASGMSCKVLKDIDFIHPLFILSTPLSGFVEIQLSTARKQFLLASHNTVCHEKEMRTDTSPSCG